MSKQGKSKKEQQNIEEKILANPKDDTINNINIKKEILDTTINKKSDYKIYSVIEIYEYNTSKKERTRGLKNPYDEFQKICDDFHIHNKNNLTYINYKQAEEIKLKSFMLWGSKDGLNKFFEEKNINNSREYFLEKSDKAGIYLCIEPKGKLAYFIVWPGEESYNYSKIDEPNNNLLLTLVRIGFFLSNNSILCFTDKEMKEINSVGDKIFGAEEEKGLTAKRYKLSKTEKEFKLENEYILNKIDNFKNIIINKFFIKENYILFYETKIDDVISFTKENTLNNFIKNESSKDFCFDNNFNINIPPDYLYKLIKGKLKLLDKNEDCLYYIKEGLNDILKGKTNEIIDKLFENMINDLLEDKTIKEIFICNFCRKRDNSSDSIFYDENQKLCFHKKCFIEQKNEWNKNINEINLYTSKIVEDERIKLYEKYKEEILKKDNIFKSLIKNFFKNYEEGVSEEKLYYIFYTKKIKINKVKLINSIDKLKENSYKYAKKNESVKKEILNRELQKYNEIQINANKNNILNNWKIKIISKLNKYFKENMKNIKEWIVLKDFKIINEKYMVIDEKKQINKRQIIANLYQISPFDKINSKKDSDKFSLVKEKFTEILEENLYLEDYLINKDGEVIKIYKSNINKKIHVVSKYLSIEEFQRFI